MKYSSTDRPSRKLALIGPGDVLALRVGHQTPHPGELPDLGHVARAPDFAIVGIGLSSRKFSSIALATSSDALAQICLTISSLRSW